MLALLVVFSTLGRTSATPLSSCEIELTNQVVLPVVTIRGSIGLLGLVNTRWEADWPQLLGRKLVIKVDHKGKVVSSRQRFLTREDLLSRVPELAEQVNEIVESLFARRDAHRRQRSPTATHWLGILPPYKRVLDKVYPGELGSFRLRAPATDWRSGVIGSFEQNQNKNLFRRLTRLDVNSSFKDLQAHVRNFRAGRPGTRPLLQVFFVHNHPTLRPAPLSHADIRAQKQIGDLLESMGQDFDFRVTFVVLSTLHQPLDVAFMRTVSRIKASTADATTYYF